MKPQVLQILTRLGAGGPPLSVIQTTRVLNRLGYPTLLVAGRCDHVDLDMSYLLSPDDPVEWIPEMSRSVSLIDDLKALWRLFRLMRRLRPAIVQTHTAKAGALGRIAARLAGVPIVIHTFHGHVLSGYFSPGMSIAIRVAERTLAKFTDVICVLAPQQEHDLVERFRVASRNQVHVLPLGLDLEPFHRLGPPLRQDGGLTVGWLGRLVQVKDIALFINVVEETLRRNDRIRFLVAGDGEERHLMEAAILRWPDSRLRWLGWMRDVPTVISECHVMVQTSRNEGTPVALIQAMAAGRPFVSTAAGGVVDLVTGSELRAASGCRWFANAVLADAAPPAFATALCELQENERLALQMGREAEMFAREHHGLQTLAVNYQRLYASLLEDQEGSLALRERGRLSTG